MVSIEIKEKFLKITNKPMNKHNYICLPYKVLGLIKIKSQFQLFLSK